MKHLLVLLSLGISSNVSAIEGTSWLQVNKEGYSIECPDFVKFTKHEYSIFNDCYGNKPTNPIIEYGSYKIKDQFLLFERNEIIKNHSFLGNGLAAKVNTQMIRNNTKEMEIKINEKSIFFKSKLPSNNALK